MFVRIGMIGAVLAVMMVVSGCSREHSGDSRSSVTSSSSSTSSSSGFPWAEGVFKPREQYSQRCLAPRDDPDYDDVLGTAMDEKLWLRSMSNELYLWNKQLEDRDPAPYTVNEYFNTLKIPTDRFHFTIPTESYLQGAHSGVYFGYGISWAILDTQNHTYGVGQIERSAQLPDTIKRGDKVLGADGVYVLDLDSDELSDAERQVLRDTLNRAFSPRAIGEAHTFHLLDRDTAKEKSIEVVAADVVHAPVPITKTIFTRAGRVGYIQFNEHNSVSEQPLIEAITQLKEEGVTELVLDLRYNGGGYIYIASKLAYMIAGPSRTSGQTFTQLSFNDDIGNSDPFTGEAIEPIPFYTSGGGALPSLNLDRLFVLTSSDTCSASELIMNGLQGVDVEIIQIGNTTCGKPYSFYPLENCGTTYFTVMSENVNAKGFSDYSGGFSPSETDFSAPDYFEGCVVDDDFTHDLGDEDEHMLAAALSILQTGDCPVSLNEAVSNWQINKVKRAPSFVPTLPAKPSMSILRSR